MNVTQMIDGRDEGEFVNAEQGGLVVKPARYEWAALPVRRKVKRQESLIASRPCQVIR